VRKMSDEDLRELENQQLQEWLRKKSHMQYSYEGLKSQLKGLNRGQQLSLLYMRIYRLLGDVHKMIKDLDNCIEV